MDIEDSTISTALSLIRHVLSVVTVNIIVRFFCASYAQLNCPCTILNLSVLFRINFIFFYFCGRPPTVLVIAV